MAKIARHSKREDLMPLTFQVSTTWEEASLTNSRGSRVAGPKVAVAGPMSRSRVQCRGRGSKVAVAGPMSRQGKMIWGF